MPTQRLFVIADNAPHEGVLAQLATLTTHLEPEQFSITSTLLEESQPSIPSPQSPAPAPALAPAPAPVPRSRRWLVDPLSVWQLKAAIQEHRPDVVLTIGEQAAIEGRLAAILARHQRIVACWPGVDFDYLSGAMSRLARFLAKRSERIILANDAEREAAAANRWPEERLAVVPPSVFPIANVSARESVLAPLGIAPTAKVIAVVAPWSPRHRVKETIWAFDLVHAMHSDAHLLIVGEGPHRTELEVFRDSQQCRDVVHFATPAQLPADWLAHCDVVWSPDPAPRVSYLTLQAAASGIPVVAVDTPTHRAFITSNDTGVLVPLAVRPAAPQATLPLLEDATLRNRLGESARQSLADRHSPAQTAAAIAAILQGSAK